MRGKRREDERCVPHERILTIRHCNPMHDALSAIAFEMRDQGIILRPTANQVCTRVLLTHYFSDDKFRERFATCVRQRTQHQKDICINNCPYWQECFAQAFKGDDQALQAFLELQS